MLTRLRLARGYSQLRLAERLCAAAGTPTVSRHEVSRWERQERIPGPFWLGWLAVVLEAPLDELEAAVTATRRELPGAGRGGPEQHHLWRPPTADELLAGLAGASDHDLRGLAHSWLAGPPDPPPGQPPAGSGPPAPDEASDPLDRLARRLLDLRRTDDLIGGAEVTGLVDRELRAAISLLREVPTHQRRRALRLVAELAQLAGWVHADAGDPTTARRAYRVALRAATASADRPLAAHVLGCLSHQCLAAGDPQQALLLAGTARAGADGTASAHTQALLLHRVALAAARAGERRAAQAALASAERIADRSRPEHEPSWLYWLDQPELTAMTGRCLAVLGRPLRAARRLAVPRRGAGHRTAALYGTWLARSYLELGEVELASRTAMRAVRDTIRAGSARAATGLRHLHPLLLRHRDVPTVRGYERLVAAVTDYLPAPVQPGPPTLARRSLGGGAGPARPPPPDSVAG